MKVIKMSVTKMNKKLFLILFMLLSTASVYAQNGDPGLLTIGLHTGNRIGISFHNDGQIAGILSGVDIRGEWPLGSGENYIGDCIPLIGVEFINNLGDTLHSVVISRGPRKRQTEEKHPTKSYFWGWNPIPGFRNPGYESIAMSHLPQSWPTEGWNDPVSRNWKDEEGRTQWFGYFGRDIKNADQESIFDADDQSDDEFNFLNNDPGQPIFLPDSRNPGRHGMALRMRVRGFQWSNFLAEDAIFWLYDIINEGTTIYRKADFGTVVGTLAGGDGDSQDDLGYFDVNEWITYSWDSDGIGNKGQKVGYVGYSFLESPGNPFDGIDNDDDSKMASPTFVQADFAVRRINAGDQVVLIDPETYERTLFTIPSGPVTVQSLGVSFEIIPGITELREGHISSIVNGVSQPHISAYDGIDNDLDGLIDENEAIHFRTRQLINLPGLRYKNYFTGAGVDDLMIDERRDNDIDEDGDWNAQFDDVGSDGLGPDDNNYPGPDPDGTEGNGIPDQGEPNFGRTDPDESDQIGLTSFNFFELQQSPDMTQDSVLWDRMTPGRFDIIPPQPQDGDFIYASGYFPLIPSNNNPDVKERFSVALLFGEDLPDIVGNKQIVQQIYNSGYKFPQPPRKPQITITHDDGKVVIYWDGTETENDRDFITKEKDFQGYKIYRSTDANFTDSRVVTNAQGILTFDKPIAQYDIIDSITGYFYPSRRLLEQVGGTTYYLGNNTGVVNRFVDSNVVAGQTYYYAVVAYDRGDATQDIFPTENSKTLRRTSTGQIVTDVNTGYITPGRRPSGYEDATIVDVTKSEGFVGTGSINIETIDDKAVKPGYSYMITFSDSGAGFTTGWSLLDLQTPDTVVIPSTGARHILNPNESVQLPEGTDTIFVNSQRVAVTGNVYTAFYDSLVANVSEFNGNTPIRHGFRVQIFNDAVVRLNTEESGFQGNVSTPLGYIFGVINDSRYPVNNGLRNPADYQIEFYPDIVGNSIADTLFPPNNPANLIPSVPVNFKVKNLTTGNYIDFAMKKSGTISTSYSIYFKEEVNGVMRRTWKLDITYTGSNTPLETAGVLNLFTVKPFNRHDFLTFKVKGPEINNAAAKEGLDRVKVVPNPYVVTHEAESRLLSSQTSGRGEREIRFTYIPPGSTINIYTVRGERIKTLTHDDIYVGDVYWNLRTDENLDAAFGVYVFVLDAPGIGTKIGKFALIK
jgi:hypothetical protein